MSRFVSPSFCQSVCVLLFFKNDDNPKKENDLKNEDDLRIKTSRIKIALKIKTPCEMKTFSFSVVGVWY